MDDTTVNDGPDAAQDGLAFVRERLSRLAAGAESIEPRLSAARPTEASLGHPQLAALISAFDLTAFEAQVILLVFGVEVLPEIAGLCADCHEDPAFRFATLRLAIALFPGGDWRAVTPSGPLRAWKLVEIQTEGGLLDAPLRLSEFTLHWMCGAPSREPPLSGALDRLGGAAGDLPPSHQVIVDRMSAARRLVAEAGIRPQALHLVCPDAADSEAVARRLAQDLDMPLDRLNLDAVFQSADRQMLGRMVQREHGLAPALLLVEPGSRDLSDERWAALAGFLERLPGTLLIVTPGRSARQLLDGPRFDVGPPTREEQRTLWRNLLGKAAAPLEPMLERFDLRRGAIQTAYQEALLAREAAGDGRRQGTWKPHLSAACRRLLRGPLDTLADRIDSRAALATLILPPTQQAQLQAIISDVENQAAVLSAWRAGGGSSRGLGLTALFSGPSGSGKTTAAEALAGALDLDLYRIDLSAIVSKYIGETEKELSRLFDAAERGANVLLFDEADALFGKRTEVRDSHDRYANQEVSFLLQKIESYKGLAILTSNLADNLDSAFLRRFRYVVEFPLPGPAEREAIWRGVFGHRIEVSDLDPVRLSRLNLSGAGIRNVALKAAFLAAAAGGPVTMPMIHEAAREEYRKLHRVMTEEELGGTGDV